MEPGAGFPSDRGAPGYPGPSSYSEILRRVSGTSTRGVTRQNVDCLIRASNRLQRAEVLALQEEGMAVADIAAVCGITRQRATVLLAPGA